MKSQLLIKTYDGSLTIFKVKPKCHRTKVEFDIKYYDYDGDGALKKAKLLFHDVISIDFAVNYFDNYIGAELFGFFEIFDRKFKKDLLEKIFNERREGYLFHGDYNYDPEEEADMLNYRENFKEVEATLDEYHLYQQQTQGGIYYILAKGYELLVK